MAFMRGDSCRASVHTVQASATQGTQYPLMKEYTLHHNTKAPIHLDICLKLRVLGSLGKTPRLLS